jgi:chromosome segregation protein
MFKLEKLEIFGFKSFADRTSLIFGDGITGVVGPNGCGKSNIAEAISWVLGEQSAKNLRGGKMEDVIFNGTRDRKPTGMAEVMLTMMATADIASRDQDEHEKEEGSEYDEAISSAERAASAARALVEEMSPIDDTETQPVKSETTDASASAADPDTARVDSGEEPAPLQIADQPQPDAEAKQAEKQSAARKFKRKRIAISAGERVTVGRRLYRTGDSDYLMNGRPCLLRDIQDLFAGTGLGGAHYAIIEQGRIGQILSSKPLDRRALIEEAAGITKFKSRKRSAELKLESAKQNLTRLNDIIAEVERQVNSLKRQAQKARRYRRLRDEMRSLLKIVFTADYYRLNESLDRIARDLDEATRDQEQLDAGLIQTEGSHRSASAKSRAVEDQLADLREKASATELEADRARNRRAFEEQQIRELSSRIEELNRDQSSLEQRLELLEQHGARRSGELAALESEIAAEQEALARSETDYQAELAQVKEREGGIESLRERLLGEIGVTERLRNLNAKLRDDVERLEARQAALRVDCQNAVDRRDAASAELQRVLTDVESSKARLAELNSRIETSAADLAAIRADAGDLRENAEKIRTELAAARHRLASLEELDAHHAYYSDAVQHVLSPDHASSINAIGTLADFVEVEPQYERLVESLFGRELQSVLVPTIDDALAGVDHIKSEGLGRGAFLVVGLHGGEGDQDAATGNEKVDDELRDRERLAPGDEGMFVDSEASLKPEDFDIDLADADPFALVPYSSDEARARAAERLFDQQDREQASRFQLDALRAIDLLGARPEIKAVVERAFPEKCSALVVPDIEAALHLSIENPQRTYVTNDGEQVVNGRLIITGAQEGPKGVSLLAVKREIKELRERSAVVAVSELGLAEELAQTNERLKATEVEASWLDQQHRDQEKMAAARNSELEGLRRDLERADQHVRALETETAQAIADKDEVEARIVSLAPELAAAESSLESLQSAVIAAQNELAEMRLEVERSSERLSVARAAAAAKNERLNAARGEMRRIEHEVEELLGRINRNKLELYESHGRVEQLTASHSEGALAAERLESELAQLTAEITAATEALASARAEVDQLEQALAGMRQAVSAAHDRRGQIEVERARIQAEAEHLARDCVSELAMSLDDVITSVELTVVAAADGHNEPADPSEVDEQPEETDSAGQLRATGSPVADADAARTRLEELRRKLDEIGPVNMMALEELEESDARFKFLSEQRRDILDSIKMTEEALAEIKRRTRERFRHAFNRINENFQQMFVELFGGGRGEMMLIDEDDILESGIDLIAQPPGKRLQNVLLLSGGEKAMAAISLVLAIFQFRPSPFCILDEVDAPLDEMNVGRFASKVVEMSGDTQFLVITHNKRTMEVARALYGVTMEERGVSKLVSVKFD